MSRESEELRRRQSPTRFAVSAALLTGLDTVACMAFLAKPPPSALVLMCNGAIAGFLVFLPYGIYYAMDSHKVVENLASKVERAASGDRKAAISLAYLTVRKGAAIDQSVHELTERVMRFRALFYFWLCLVLAVVLAVWTCHETARQGGRFIWDWEVPHWHWP